MRSGEVLSLIWQDGVTLPIHDNFRAFEALFSRILPVRSAALLAGPSCTRPLAMSDELELAPALPLGDVLVEELPIDLPYGTMVLFLPEAEADLSLLLGGAVGESLQLMINLAGIPMERETDALYLTAHAAMRRAAGLRAQGAKLDTESFGLGLGRSLERHWVDEQGGRLPDPTVFSRPDFLWQPSLQGYLSRLDPGFTAPDPRMINGDLLRVADKPLVLSEWVGGTEAVLRAVLGAPERETPSLQSRFAARFNLR
ncbi:hypothetical protein KUV62_21280 [Salipiger bermudensis]|uniref:hypothetical protein n=1 Tax=Salipiger bermudensis TaxID=344736 RepID=UPI001C9963CE|nr:hypothetical protein [Salipiger bermudensis]MBY6006471.1 hypothetical protein [Salipiger bermudensis]